MFTLDLTLRSRIYADENKRKILQNNAVAAAIASHFTIDFLVDCT